MPRDKNLIRVKEAAELLGVCPNTVRAWGAEGRIPEYRHPVNNYRLFKRDELERLMKRVEDSARHPKKRSHRKRTT
jgi:DNA (cytosine-5)-methyltransferase 1